jgi:hypothetical protein
MLVISGVQLSFTGYSGRQSPGESGNLPQGKAQHITSIHPKASTSEHIDICCQTFSKKYFIGATTVAVFEFDGTDTLVSYRNGESAHWCTDLLSMPER